jgi:hypothetical protein
MQFDLSVLETGTLVFIGTLILAGVLAAFVVAAGLVALVVLGTGKLAWKVAAASLVAVVRSINAGWDRLVHSAAQVDAGPDLQTHPASGTGTYPRVILRDS